MFNRKFLFITGLVLVAIIALGALVWLVGPRLGWGPMALGREMHPGMWPAMRPGLRGFEGMMPHTGLGGMFFGVAFRLLGWLLQIGLVVAIVTWLLRRNPPPLQPAQPASGPSASPSEPSAPTQP